MEEKSIQMSKRSWLLWSAGLFFLYAAILLGVSILDPLTHRLGVDQIVPMVFLAAIGALSSGFVICGLIAVVRSFKSGYLVATDLIYPALFFIALSLMAGSYFMFGRLAGFAEIIILVICASIVVILKKVRLVRSRRDPDTDAENISARL